ncbi:MAG: RHS repeat-associated core domain-containing protein [Erysipelotrichaceae bacterium]|nr:RHS repeat-associated core domain-containing protein [Erysipelotrichaceae bacterium]
MGKSGYEIMFNGTSQWAKLTTRNGFSYGFTFDSLGNPTSVKMGTSPLITHSYQARTSRLLSSEYANGGKVEYIYDTLDRVIGVKIDNATSPQFEYRYDASGNLAIIKDNLRNITTYLEYDLANRLSKITDNQGHAITYGFDAKNRLSGVSEVLKGTTYTSSYTYNADNQPATVSADGKTHSYTYDLLGRLSGTSLNTTTPYTTALTYKTNPSTGSSSHVLASYRSGSTTSTYQVDANGNITQLSDGTHTFTYVYDDFNQLIRENNPLLNKSITYQYDLGGNLLAVNEYAYTTGDLGSPTSTVVYTYGSAWKDQLTRIGNDDLTYDTNGNLLSYKTRSYSWQAGRQLAQITDTNLNALYTYNESGIRTRKEVNEVITDYVLEGGKVILETTGSDTLHYSYDSRGQLVSFSLNGTPYFYTRNGQGDITGLIDASGVEVVKYTYDSWGKPISITGSLALTVGTMNPYRYRGYRYDHESGLYYLQSRYYDPSIKRFISADSVIAGVGGDIQGNNLYSYCFNNPVNMSDPSGHWPLGIWKGAFHLLVQKDIKKNFPLIETEKPCTFPNGGKGRLDVYDPISNQFYEVKPNSYRHIVLGYNQIQNYSLSTVKNGKVLMNPLIGSQVFKGTITTDRFIVEYRTYDTGLILYDVFYNFPNLNPETAKSLIRNSIGGLIAGGAIGVYNDAFGSQTLLR